MKEKKITKNKSVMASLLCVFLLLGGAATVVGAQGADNVLLDGHGYLRAIKVNYLEEKAGEVSADTLEPNSKWQEVPDEIPEWSKSDDPNATLKEHLETVLSADLTDWESCAPGAQVWEFSAEEIMGTADEPGVRDWCLENPKGTDTNKEFLNKFEANRTQHKTN